MDISPHGVWKWLFPHISANIGLDDTLSLLCQSDGVSLHLFAFLSLKKRLHFFFINWLVFIFYDCSFHFFAWFSFELFFLFWDLCVYEIIVFCYSLSVIFYSYLLSNRNFLFYVVIFFRFLFLYSSLCVLF